MSHMTYLANRIPYFQQGMNIFCKIRSRTFQFEVFDKLRFNLFVTDFTFHLDEKSSFEYVLEIGI